MFSENKKNQILPSIEELLRKAVESKASDLHIKINSEPMFRIHGELTSLGFPFLTPEQCEVVCRESIPDNYTNDYIDAAKEIDFAIEVPGASRFRANIFRVEGTLTAVFRVIPYEILDFDSLGLPSAAKRMADPKPGLVLVTGATGSGKSTTLAAMIDKINKERADHILTIEDPIEFIHNHKKSRISQREVGRDTGSFADALKYALREDPDTVLVGEMRDLETIGKALTIAETGHLVMATLHTSSSVGTINRIIDVFPPEQQAQVRTQLSFTLKGVLSQKLLPLKNGKGRILAVEALLPNSGIRALIRDGKIHQIEGLMQTGQKESGMMTMDQYLIGLVESDKISAQIAIQYANEPDQVRDKLPHGAFKLR